MTLQCSRCTSTFYTMKNTGVLTTVILRRYNHLCPGLNFMIFRFRFKFNKVCDFSLNSIRYTKIRCLDDFSVRCAEIYNFMPIDQQAPACRFYKIYKIYDFSLTSRFFNKPLRNLRFFAFLCNAISTYSCRPADFTKFSIFRS